MSRSSLKAVPVPAGPTTGGADGDFSYLPDQAAANAPVKPSVGTSDNLGFDLPDKKPAIEGVYGQVSTVDPQRASEVLQLSKRLDHPENFIDKNLDNIKAAVKAPGPSFFAELEQQYPDSTKFLSDPKNMAATHDDLQNVTDHESLFQKAKKVWDFEKNAFQSGGLKEELAFLQFHQMMGSPNEGDQQFRFGGAAAAGAGITTTDPELRMNQIQAKIDELAKTKPEGFGIKQGLFGATEFIPQMMSGFGYGLKGIPSKLQYVPKGPLAAPLIGAAAYSGFGAGELEYNYKLMAGTSYGELSKIRDDKGNPLPEDVKKIASIGMGAGMAGLSMVKVGAVLETIPGGKQFLTKFMASAGEKVLSNPETLGGALQAFAKNYATSVAHGVAAMEGITAINIAGSEGAKAASGQPFEKQKLTPGEVGKQILDTATDAAFTFGALALPGTGINLAHDLSAANKTDQAKQFYMALGNTAEASKLRERLPEAHQEMIARMTKDSPVENIYIPVKDAEVYFQGKNIDTGKAMDEIGARKSYEEAKATGGDIQIPLSDWASKIVGTEHYKGLADDIKFSPEDLTKREVETRRTEIEGKIKEAEAQSKGEETAQASADVVHEDVARQLKDSGYTEDQANQYAQVYGSAFKTLGERAGVKPEELYNQYKLRISAGDPVAAIDKEIEAVKAKPQTMETAAEIQRLNQERVVMNQAGAPARSVTFPVKQSKEGVFSVQPRDDTGAAARIVGDEMKIDNVDFNPKYLGVVQDMIRSLEKTAVGASAKTMSAKVDDPKLQKAFEAQGFNKGEDGVMRKDLEASKTFNQGGEEGPRGQISFGKDRQFSIDMMKNADLSTFLHESGHFYLEVLGDLASNESAPKDIKDDYATVLKWLGVESRDQIKTEHHEQFARGFEAYLMEGKAPTLELQSTFAKFKSWLTGVYKQLKALNVQLTPEVKSVFDRMLATQQEIDLAQHDIGYHQDLIKDLDPKVANRLHTMQARARDTAERALMKEQIKDLRAKNSEFLKAERTRIEMEAHAQVKSLPIFKAIDDIGGVKTGRKSVAELASKFLDHSIDEDNAAHFEVAAEVHGFGSGEDLANQIGSATAHDAFNKLVKGHVDAAMEQYAPLKDTDQIKIEALKAIHDTKMTELLALEHEILKGLIQNAELGTEVAKRRRAEASVAASTAKTQAKALLDSKPVKDAGNFRTYITAERNAAKRVAAAIEKKDYESAAKFKEQQMLNHALAAEAMRNREEAKGALNYLSQFAAREDMKKLPYAFIRQVDQLLSGVGLADPRGEDRPTLIKVAQDMMAKGEEPGDIANATGLVVQDGKWLPETLPGFVKRVNDNYYALTVDPEVMNIGKKDANELSMSELRGLKDTIKTISEIGKKYGQYLGLYKQVDIRAAAAEFRGRVEQAIGKPKADELAPGEKVGGPLDRVMASISNASGAIDRWLDNILTITNKFDGLKEGPAKDNIYRPIKEAEDRKMARLHTAMKDLDGIFAAHYEQNEFAKYKDTKFDIEGRNFSKEEILSMALNWGNAGNKDRIMRGFGFDENKMQQIFNHLGKKDWDFAQSVWDHLHTFWPDIVKLEMDVAGIEPKGVDPESFQNQHGNYKGGYYPISYDFDKSVEAFKHTEEKDALYKQRSTAKAQTNQGHTEARVQTLARPIRLSLDVLKDHYEDIIHDLEFRRPIIDVNRFLNQKDSRAAITNALGVRGYKAIGDWLKAAASSPSEPIAFGDTASRWFRFKTTFFNLGYRLVSTPKIALENMVNVAAEVGVPGAARAMFNYYTDGSTHEMVISKSQFMKDRATHLNRDFSDISEWKGTNQNAFKKYAFAIHAILDGGFSFPLWADTYQRAIGSHGDEKLAINQADESVKKSFMSGGKTELPAIMRGSEKQKLLTMAYSYQSMMWNRFSTSKFEAGMEWAQGHPVAAVSVVARATVYQFLAPALIAALTREFLRNNQTSNEEDKKKRVIGTIAEEANPLKFIPILRDLNPYLIKKAMGEKPGHIQSTPLESAAETILNPVGDLFSATFGHQPLNPKIGEETVNAFSLLVGIPKQVNDIAFNYIDWQSKHGEATWRDAITRRTKK